MNTKIINIKNIKFICALLVFSIIIQFNMINIYASENEFNIHDGELWSYSGTAENIIIPDGVKVIKREAFLLNHTAKSVTIPDSVVRLEEDVFNQSSIETIKIGTGLQLISKDAFIQAYNLNKIIVDSKNPVYTIKNGVLFNKATNALVWYPPIKETFDYEVPEGTLRIEDFSFGQLFNAPTGITNIKLPNSLNYLGTTFYDCENLNSFELPKNLLVAQGLVEQHGLKEELDIPANIIDMNFPDGYKAINVDINNKYYKSIDGVLFNKDGTVLIKYPVGTNKKSYTVPKGIVAIYDRAFINSNLNEVILPEGLEIIGEYSFCGVPLKDIKFPNSLKFIGSGAFSGQGFEPTEITLPPNLEDIGAASFNDTNLQKVTVPNANTNLSGSNSYPFVFKNDESTSVTVYGYSGGITEEKAEKYNIPFVSLGNSNVQKSKEYKCYLDFNIQPLINGNISKATVDKETGKIIIPHDTPYVSLEMFEHIEDKDSIKSIEIPNTVRIIKPRAFQDFKNLESVTIPENVVYVGREAFNLLENVKYIKILNPNVYLDEKFILDIGYHFDSDFERNDIKYTFEGYDSSSTQAFANAYMCDFVNLGVTISPTSEINSNNTKEIEKKNENAIDYKGGKYIGDVKNGLPHGYGLYTSSKDGEYVGEWKNGKQNGFGKTKCSDGVIYAGYYKNGFIDGQAIIFYPDGSSYIGKMKKFERMGYGIYIYNNGDKYLGEFKNDSSKYYGTYMFNNGNKYMGEWINDNFNGEGILIYNDDTCVVGEWSNDQFIESKDILKNYEFIAYNGGYYFGEVKNKVPNGYGTLIEKNGDIYVGEFNNGNFNGKGTQITYQDGIVYTMGEFKDNLLNGEGVRTVTYYSNQKAYIDIYIGKFIEEQLTGRGLNIFMNLSEDISTYIGEWKHGSQNGNGIIKDSEGNVYIGEFKDNKFIK